MVYKALFAKCSICQTLVVVDGWAQLPLLSGNNTFCSTAWCYPIHAPASYNTWMQPLDTYVFSSLKTHWQEVCHDYLQQHPGRVITKYQFSSLFSNAWGKALMPLSIISDFKCTGVYPFNPQIVLEKCPVSDHPATPSVVCSCDGQ